MAIVSNHAVGTTTVNLLFPGNDDGLFFFFFLAHMQLMSSSKVTQGAQCKMICEIMCPYMKSTHFCVLA